MHELISSIWRDVLKIANGLWLETYVMKYSCVFLYEMNGYNKLKLNWTLVVVCEWVRNWMVESNRRKWRQRCPWEWEWEKSLPSTITHSHYFLLRPFSIPSLLLAQPFPFFKLQMRMRIRIRMQMHMQIPPIPMPMTSIQSCDRCLSLPPIPSC